LVIWNIGPSFNVYNVDNQTPINQEENMNKKVFWTSLIITVLFLSACAAPRQLSSENEKLLFENQRGVIEAPSAMDSAGAPQSPQPNTTAGNAATVEFKQMIIMNANLEIAVDDPGTAMSAIQKMAADMGGFTVSSNIYKTYTPAGIEVPAATLTVRVPAEKLNEALDKIKALTGDPVKYTLTENISGQDVTQDYTDLKSRLRNLEEANAKLSELYDKAIKTEDALAIYQQKVQVTEQIEVIKGQMQYYEQASAKSAITVQIVAKESIAPITVAGWTPKGAARDALQALIDFGKGLVDFLIWFGVLVIPILVVIGLPIFLLVRFFTRRNRREQARKQEAMRNQQPPLTK
jgi:hypothetical protein